MICIIVNSDDSIGGAAQCPPERESNLEAAKCLDARLVEIDMNKFKKAKLPPGVSETNLSPLADRCCYFREVDGEYEFSDTRFEK